MRVFFMMAILLATPLAAESATDDVVTRDPAVLDTGRPLNAAKSAYDVRHYTLRHDVRPASQTIAGSATIRFRARRPLVALELDFDGLFAVSAVDGPAGPLDFQSGPATLTVTLATPMASGEERAITVHYEGAPRVAPRAPWDGGFVWAETPSGKPWIATAFQGEGCDIWWPCKDHGSDEPDEGADLFFTVPEGLSAASNGILQSVTEEADGRRTFHWRTTLATNQYGIALNVAPYVRIRATHRSVNGADIPIEFWALEDHEHEARALVADQLPGMIDNFERRVGPYPWGAEKLGIAETPHLGMEHQTINAYGNGFKRDDYGFDWLLYHELAHEWFGNLMSAPNNADMWLHEGFAAYLQLIYTVDVMGEAAFHGRMYKSYQGIRACAPVAPRGDLSDDQMFTEDDSGPGGDMYSKGAWVLHSLRYLIGEEAFWRSVKRLVYDTPTPETLTWPITPRDRTTDDFLAIASDEAGVDLAPIFEVYLRRGALPQLRLTADEGGVALAWETPDDLTFPMAVPVRVRGELRRIDMPAGEARIAGVTLGHIQIDPMMQILRKLKTVPTCAERQAEEAAAEN